MITSNPTMNFDTTGKEKRMWCNIPNKIPDMTDDSDLENGEMDLLSPFHGLLSHKNDILSNKSYGQGPSCPDSRTVLSSPSMGNAIENDF